MSHLIRLRVRTPGTLPPEGELALDVAGELSMEELAQLIEKQHPLRVASTEQRLILGGCVLRSSAATLRQEMTRVRGRR